MKKALLTVLLVLLSVSSVFAVNYGISVEGVYSTHLTDDTQEEMELSFLPYLYGDKFRVDFRFDWDIKDGFSPLKTFNLDDYYTTVESALRFLDYAHLDVGEDAYLEINRFYDDPTFTISVEKEKFEFNFDLQGTRNAKGYEELFPAYVEHPFYLYNFACVTDVKVVSYNEEFPVEFYAGLDVDFDITDEDNFYSIVEPNVKVVLPVQINSHQFKFGAKVASQKLDKFDKGTYKEIQPLLKNWTLTADVETTFGPLTLDVWAELEKEEKGTSQFCLGSDAELKILSGTLDFGFGLPFATTDSWGLITQNNISQEYAYASLHVGDWLYGGINLEVTGFAKAINDKVKLEDFVEPDNGHVELDGFIGFTTKPFNFLLSADLLKVNKPDASLKMTFGVNADNFFSNK